MADPWNEFISPNYYTARVHISKYWATVEKYVAQGWIEYHTVFDGNRAIITFKRKEEAQ